MPGGMVDTFTKRPLAAARNGRKGRQQDERAENGHFLSYHIITLISRAKVTIIAPPVKQNGYMPPVSRGIYPFCRYDDVVLTAV